IKFNLLNVSLIASTILISSASISCFNKKKDEKIVENNDNNRPDNPKNENNNSDISEKTNSGQEKNKDTSLSDQKSNINESDSQKSDSNISDNTDEKDSNNRNDNVIDWSSNPNGSNPILNNDSNSSEIENSSNENNSENSEFDDSNNNSVSENITESNQNDSERSDIDNDVVINEEKSISDTESNPEVNNNNSENNESDFNDNDSVLVENQNSETLNENSTNNQNDSNSEEKHENDISAQENPTDNDNSNEDLSNSEVKNTNNNVVNDSTTSQNNTSTDESVSNENTFEIEEKDDSNVEDKNKQGDEIMSTESSGEEKSDSLEHNKNANPESNDENNSEISETSNLNNPIIIEETNDTENSENVDTSTENEEINNQNDVANNSNQTDSNANESDNNYENTSAYYYETHPNAKTLDSRSDGDASLEYGSNREYLSLIQNRSFSLTWTFDDGSFSAGTIWLLDYKEVENRHYKLYFGTNYHVAADIFGDNDLPEYVQSARVKKINSMILGFTKQLSGETGADFKYLTLEKQNYPRNFFLARNFMDNANYEYDGRNHYTDFAVLEMDFDFNKLPKNIFKPNTDAFAVAKQILKSVETLDESIQRFENTSNKFLMTDNFPYAQNSYGSGFNLIYNVIGEKEFKVLNDIDTYEKAQTLDEYITNAYGDNDWNIAPKRIYFYGYPIVDQKNLVLISSPWDQLYTHENRDNVKNGRVIWITHNEYHNREVADHGNRFNDEIVPAYYGLAFESAQSNRVRGGASGSLVINEQGLPIGLLFASVGNDFTVVLDNDNKYRTLYTTLITPFTNDVVWSTNNGTIYPYNLIDGSDKSKYSHQLNSYREQLSKVYGSDYTTRLFG
ncbi:MIP family Ig-specific serine endopeptidase, partial [Mycoplasmopsis pullorum]